MKHLVKILLVVLAVMLVGCSSKNTRPQSNNIEIHGSGIIVAREVANEVAREVARKVAEQSPYAGFDQVEAGLHFDITVKQGEAFSIVLFSDDNFIDFIRVEQTGTKISFGYKPGYAYNVYGVTLRAEVTMPELAGLYLNGSSHAQIDGFQSVENFEADLTGSSAMTGELEADNVRLVLSGNTFVKLAGSSETLRVEANQNSVVDLGNYRAKKVEMETSGVSQSLVNARENLVVNAAQNSHVFYAGDPVARDIQAHESASVEPKK